MPAELIRFMQNAFAFPLGKGREERSDGRGGQLSAALQIAKANGRWRSLQGDQPRRKDRRSRPCPEGEPPKVGEPEVPRAFRARVVNIWLKKG